MSEPAVFGWSDIDRPGRDRKTLPLYDSSSPAASTRSIRRSGINHISATNT